MKAAHEILFEDHMNATEQRLKKSVNSYANIDFLSFLSDLGELKDEGRERILQLARVTYDYKIEQEEPSAWDYGCYRD
jgi:hypothetical protein